MNDERKNDQKIASKLSNFQFSDVYFEIVWLENKKCNFQSFELSKNSLFFFDNEETLKDLYRRPTKASQLVCFVIISFSFCTELI